MLSYFLPLTLLTASLASAQNIVENLSFGHKTGISPNAFNIPGWSMLGEGYVPQLMSDKVIMTPPYGGNKRGALWSQAKIQSSQWSAELEFRAGGVDNGKGNLQFWYMLDGEKKGATASIYTVGKFDGLAIVIDTNAGMQKIRGFLNDGTIDYKNHNNVDSLAFGHCDYNYRNLGRPSKLSVLSTTNGLQVQIDGKQCFNTNKVTLPIDYNYGITAASNDPPDSFEVFKLTTSTLALNANADTGRPAVPVKPIVDKMLKKPGNGDSIGTGAGSNTGSYMSSEAQFQDLNARLNQLSKSISNMFAEINTHTKAEEQRYQEILRQLPSTSIISNLESRISNLDRTLAELSSELKGGNHKEQFAKLAQQLEETHQGLTQHLPGKMRDYVQNHTPRIGFIVFSFMAFQSCCLGFLLWQKWRKSTMPKKFL